MKQLVGDLVEKHAKTTVFYVLGGFNGPEDFKGFERPI